MKNQRVPVTWGPRGKPAPGTNGTICYRHKHMDWAVHRLTPALHKYGGPRQKRAVEKFTEFPRKDSKLGKTFPSVQGIDPKHRPEMGKVLLYMSPRWGPGTAPGRKSRYMVPLPEKHEIEVSHKTVTIGAAGVSGNTALYYDRHRNGKLEHVKKTRRAPGNHGKKPYH